jgi:tRNA pseudouridine38-40 synthase
LRYAFRVAYDGSGYFGFARQPGVPTVEGELLDAFKKSGLLGDVSKADYSAASRTDRGVSAVGQVVALNVLKTPNLRALNGLLPRDIAILSAAEVPPEFDPRKKVVQKHYRYICEAPPNFDLEIAKEASKLLTGTHDFRNFCKRDRKSTALELKRVSVRGKKILTMDFFARAFLRQMVRRLASAIIAAGAGEMSIQEIERAISGKSEMAIKPAPAEGLILMDIKYRNLNLGTNAGYAEKFVNYLKEKHKSNLRSAAVLYTIMHSIKG